MTPFAPSKAEIEAQLGSVLQRSPEVRLIGIRARARAAWPESIGVSDRVFRLAWCDSPLAVRQTIAADGEAGAGLAVLTPLSDEELGADVVARFHRGRVLSIDNWEMVRDAFRARRIDFRLRGKNWLADLLLERTPPGGYPPVPGGVLDADTAWGHVLDRAIGLDDARPDAERLLAWTIEPSAADRLAQLGDPVGSDIASWLGDVSGPAGALVVACVMAGYGTDALPLGLVCGVIFAAGRAEPDLAAAAVRLESFVGRRKVDAVAGRRWAEAATAVVRKERSVAKRRLLDRADRLLAELHVAPFAALSPVLRSGFEARRGNFASALKRALGDPSREAMQTLEGESRRLTEHDIARDEARSRERAHMAVRLVRWLRQPEKTPGSFSEAAHAYAGEGGFVDWARRALMGGDEDPQLTDAYAALCAQARARREAENRNFARLLKAWNAMAAVDGDVVPAEAMLDRVLAPLAEKASVLMILLDGLSFPVFRELSERFGDLGWNEFIPSDRDRPEPVIAALPTVTEISRASLLCGRLARGTAPDEKAGFATHPALTTKTRGKPPVLFHKGELGDTTGLDDKVRAIVADRGQRVVGVVHNAVDDHLAGAQQLHQVWSLDDLHVIRPLLWAAREAERIIVMTADHGHVLEDGTALRSADPGNRWRPPSGAVHEDECEIGGGRVLTPHGQTTAVMACSEGIRYAAKKNGYHGGVTPQEVVVPLVVLSATEHVSGWKPAAPALPSWWLDQPEPEPQAPPPAALPPMPRLPKGKAGQPTLFDQPERSHDWIDSFFLSPVFAAQKRLVARGAPRDEDLRKILEALQSRGGRLNRVALAQKIGQPMMRLPGLLSAARRILNLDQTEVLTVDATTDAVELNIGLLHRQFELEREG